MELGNWIFVVFLILIMLITSLVTLAVLESRRNCEAVGGTHIGDCIKEIDGEYIRGSALKINNQIVFVENK